MRLADCALENCTEHAPTLTSVAAAAELPTHLLAKVLADATGRSTNGYIYWQGLRTLVRCSVSSTQFRAAAELAATQLSLSLSDDYGVPPAGLLVAPGIHTWLGRLSNLLLSLTGKGQLIAQPGFRTFLARCDGRPIIQAHLEGKQDNLSVLRCETALAASASVQTYHCFGYVPAQFPPQVRTVVISTYPAPLPAGALETLLVRLQNSPHLDTLSLDSTENEARVSIQLRASELAGLELPSLRTLELRLELSSLVRFDASWLGQPRAFALDITLEDTWDKAEAVARLRTMRGLSEILHESDSLTMSGHEMPLREQLALSSLRLAACTLSLDAVDVLHLPHAPKLQLSFWTSPARLAWAAITKCAGRVVLKVGFGCDLEVLGCDHVAPAFGSGWQLTVYCEGAHVRGLPHIEPRGGGVLVFANPAAASWEPGHFEPDE